MEQQELVIFINKTIKERPDLASEITDLWRLFLDEVEDGGSRQHEAELCPGSIQDLLEE